MPVNNIWHNWHYEPTNHLTMRPGPPSSPPGPPESYDPDRSPDFCSIQSPPPFQLSKPSPALPGAPSSAVEVVGVPAGLVAVTEDHQGTGWAGRERKEEQLLRRRLLQLRQLQQHNQQLEKEDDSLNNNYSRRRKKQFFKGRWCQTNGKV